MFHPFASFFPLCMPVSHHRSLLPTPFPWYFIHWEIVATWQPYLVQCQRLAVAPWAGCERWHKVGWKMTSIALLQCPTAASFLQPGLAVDKCSGMSRMCLSPKGVVQNSSPSQYWRRENGSQINLGSASGHILVTKQVITWKALRNLLNSLYPRDSQTSACGC